MHQPYYVQESMPGSYTNQSNVNINNSNNNNSTYGFLTNRSQQQQYLDQVDNLQLYTNDQIDDITQLHQTSTQRVTQAMYPESTENSQDVPLTQYSNQQTAVQKLAEPSQMLKNAVVNLINYQYDADLATRALPELIKLLNDDDPVVVGQAAMIVLQLSKKEASRHALATSSQLIKALLHILEHSNDIETTRVVSEVIHNLSENSQGLLVIFKAGGIVALIRALSSPIDIVVFNALSTIHNLLLHQEGAKMNVRLNGGLQKLVMLLQRDNPKFLTLVADCLHILAYGNQEGKLIILASGGPAELIRILHSYEYDKLLFTVARAIKVLSVCPSNKPAIIQAGGIQALALRLNSQRSKRLAQECLWALRNLSDATTNEHNVEPLLQMLVQLLESTDVNMVTCAVGTLSNMTCNNQNNKNFVCKIGGLQALLQTIRNADGREEITEPATCALRHLTDRHPDAVLAQDSIRMVGGLEDIARLLDTKAKWPLVAAASGLIRNLAYNKQNASVFRDLDVVNKLSLLLIKAFQAYQEQPQGVENFADIRLERVLDSLLSALQSMINYHQFMPNVDVNLISTLVSLLYNEHESIVIMTLTILSQIAQDPSLTAIIENQGAVQILSNLILSSNDSIRQRAALLFSLVSSDKSPEYTQRLSNEINTLFQGDMANSQWAGGQDHDVPAVYAMEGNDGTIQGQSSIHSLGNRQNMYSTYVPHQDVEVPELNRNNQPQTSNENLDHPMRHNSQLQTQEPWYDTDL